jgi:transforming growth factor-beta-induced protein
LNASNGTVHVINAVLLPVETVADVAIDNGFSTLVTAVITAELLPALTNPLANYTVFAPTNAAFDNLATALNTTVSGLLALPNLADILTYHVLGTEVPSTAVTNGAIVQPLSTTNTLKLTATSSGSVFVNHAQVTAVDINADNGIVHVLNAVVLPVETVADVAIDNGFSTLVTAVVTAELLPALTNPLANYTVFAPTNDAFADLADDLGTTVNALLALPNLADILTYHVLGTEVPSSAVTNGAIVQPLSTTNTLKLTETSTGNVFVNQVTAVDINADNGIVHVLNAVVLPVETVADVAIDNGFSTLVTAVVTAELLPALTNPLANYTVFAPTNEAFTDLADALGTTVNGLLALPNLADILTYHVTAHSLS